MASTQLTIPWILGLRPLGHEADHLSRLELRFRISRSVHLYLTFIYLNNMKFVTYFLTIEWINV